MQALCHGSRTSVRQDRQAILFGRQYLKEHRCGSLLPARHGDLQAYIDWSKRGNKLSSHILAASDLKPCGILDIAMSWPLPAGEL